MNKYPTHGPRWPRMGQYWTPPEQALELWREMGRYGYDPRTHRNVGDLAAGIGRLLMYPKQRGSIVLGVELDPMVFIELSILVKKPNRACCLDFRWLGDQAPQLECVVGNPPWIYDEQGRDLNQLYLEAADLRLLPGGLMGLIVPAQFQPITAYEVLVSRPLQVPWELPTSLWIMRKPGKLPAAPEEVPIADLELEPAVSGPSMTVSEDWRLPTLVEQWRTADRLAAYAGR